MENAIKYSPQDRHLKVELGRRGSYAAISVADRGMGIPAAEKSRIFEAFYRVERGLVHNVKGSGLGLSLVKHIVEAHRGRITVDSRPGEGSTFTMLIPLDGREHGGTS
jgi:two-component system phosphate regulon sensor histidine kinase PhoR